MNGQLWEAPLVHALYEQYSQWPKNADRHPSYTGRDSAHGSSASGRAGEAKSDDRGPDVHPERGQKLRPQRCWYSNDDPARRQPDEPLLSPHARTMRATLTSPYLVAGGS